MLNKFLHVMNDSLVLILYMSFSNCMVNCSSVIVGRASKFTSGFKN